MIGIEQICNAIQNLFKNVRTPFPQISRTLLVSSIPQRPGLSNYQSIANVTKELSKMGIPTGPMPDGSPNLTVAFAAALTEETFRAIKHDMSIQVGSTPGTMEIMAQGANAGGPIVVMGTNLTPGTSFGLAT